METKTVKDSLLKIRMALLDCTREAQDSEVRELLYCTATFLCEAMLAACGDETRSTSEIAAELVTGCERRADVLRATRQNGEPADSNGLWDGFSPN